MFAVPTSIVLEMLSLRVAASTELRGLNKEHSLYHLLSMKAYRKRVEKGSSQHRSLQFTVSSYVEKWQM